MPASSPLGRVVPLLLLAAQLAAAGSASADLLISEYVEGSANNKAIEVYNPTGAAVDLAAGGYALRFYFNGSPTAGLQIPLTGTVAAGDVYVVAQASASAAILAVADQTNGDGWYNGDDAVELRHGVVIDAIGRVGEDPGSQWGTGNASTADNTLRRKLSVCTGDTASGDAFDPAAEWDGFANDTFDGLGVHNAGCSGGEVAPFVVATMPANGATGVAVDAAATIQFSEAVAVVGGWFDLTCDSSGGHSAAVSGGPISYTIDPDASFADAEECTVSVFAANVADADTADPPDVMTADHVFSFTVGGGGGGGDLPLVINEVVADHAGADIGELVEIWGQSSTSYAGATVVLLDGDADPGVVLGAWAVGTTNGAGLWTTPALATDTIPDGALTVLLVKGFVGIIGQDLDANDDGALDASPWSALVDAVALASGVPGDLTYSAVVLAPGFGGDPTRVGGASRIPQGVDTNTVADWVRNDFDGEGLDGFPDGTLGAGEARNTPGTTNRGRAADYWAGIEATSPAALRSAIHARLDDHQRFAYSSSDADTWEVLELADENPADPGEIIDVYKNAAYVKQGGGNTSYNREHTWPQSLGFPDDGVTNYPRTDCHHLFLSDINYNSDRGSRPFGTCSAACSRRPTVANNGVGGTSGVYPSDSNWVTGADDENGIFEVWSHRKGDVARALLYLDVRYEGGFHGATGYPEPDLVLTDNLALIGSSGTGSNELLAYMGRLSALLAWHAADPPDADERSRNDAVWTYQGNRNPFVDHPSWVSCVYLGACDGPLLVNGFEEGTLAAWSGWTP